MASLLFGIDSVDDGAADLTVMILTLDFSQNCLQVYYEICEHLFFAIYDEMHGWSIFHWNSDGKR